MLRSVCGWDYEDALCADAGGLGAENKPLMNGRWTGADTLERKDRRYNRRNRLEGGGKELRERLTPSIAKTEESYL